MSQHNPTLIQDAQIRAAAMETPILERDEELDLVRRWAEEQDFVAREKLLLAHGKLVLGVAKRFRRTGIPFQDLVNEGNLGLMRALETYDPSSGNRFSTYAGWWVRSFCQDLAMSSMTVLRLGRSRSERDGVRALARGDREKAREQGLSESEIVRLEAALNPLVFSIHEPAGDDGGDFEALLSDEYAGAEEMLELAVEESRGEVINRALQHLSARERHIVEQRFFIDDKRTLRDISEEMEISAERVRQIEQGALARLRAFIESCGYVADDLIAVQAR